MKLQALLSFLLLALLIAACGRRGARYRDGQPAAITAGNAFTRIHRTHRVSGSTDTVPATQQPVPTATQPPPPPTGPTITSITSPVRPGQTATLRATTQAGASCSNRIRGYVEDSGEGRWTIMEALSEDVPAPVITLSLLERLRSRQAEAFSAKVIAALRKEFGGHALREVSE